MEGLLVLVLFVDGLVAACMFCLCFFARIVYVVCGNARPLFLSPCKTRVHSSVPGRMCSLPDSTEKATDVSSCMGLPRTAKAQPQPSFRRTTKSYASGSIPRDLLGFKRNFT